jgi:hypothetical protein
MWLITTHELVISTVNALEQVIQEPNQRNKWLYLTNCSKVQRQKFHPEKLLVSKGFADLIWQYYRNYDLISEMMNLFQAHRNDEFISSSQYCQTAQ